MKNLIEAKEYSYAEIREVLRLLREDYPFIEQSAIGKSVMGREITALTLGGGRDGGGEYVLYAGAFHGMERLTCTVLLRLAVELGELHKEGGLSLPEGRGIIIVPLVNPDGYEIALRGAPGCGCSAARICRLCSGDYRVWNANARGVDINHNFDAGWKQLQKLEQAAGIYGPGPTRYGGPRPESEPETAALTALCRALPIRQVLALHSQGEVIYWDYGKNTPARSRSMAEAMAKAADYALEEPEEIASMGGFKDWFIEEFGRPGFTVEIGRGTNPLPPADLPVLYERVKKLLLLAALL